MTRILIVEDEPVIAMLLEEMLTDHGFTIVAIASTLEQARALAESMNLQGALLDVNLGEDEVFPVARLLEERGVPFAFTTGYGSIGLPPDWEDRPVFCKPYDIQLLAETLSQLTGKVD
ncbi:response regulator [uncultured Halopseudomonas sp.]|uniref:response regulator n=1 Tax=uncultured Halopseudomonas sp. TaxID=2901193 RepID=UPI0030EDA4C3|tara:strand:- start:26515 stop:26868 length:354 start_codon:yes stop_codon:yes gene_type:complete